jgi:hypothetical protein
VADQSREHYARSVTRLRQGLRSGDMASTGRGRRGCFLLLPPACSVQPGLRARLWCPRRGTDPPPHDGAVRADDSYAGAGREDELVYRADDSEELRLHRPTRQGRGCQDRIGGYGVRSPCEDLLRRELVFGARTVRIGAVVVQIGAARQLPPSTRGDGGACCGRRWAMTPTRSDQLAALLAARWPLARTAGCKLDSGLALARPVPSTPGVSRPR